MRELGEVAHTVPLVYQPTELPGRTMKRLEGALLPVHPYTHTLPPCTHSQWVVGPGSPPRGRAVGAGGALDPGRPTPRQEAPTPGRPRAAPTARKASSQERALWGW